MNPRACALGTILAVLFLAIPWSEARTSTETSKKAVVSLMQEVDLSGATVVLASIAKINSNDGDLNLRLALVKVSSAPKPGSTIYIGRARLELALRRAGLLDRVSLEGPQRVKVRRPSQGLAWSQMVDAAKAALRTAFEEDPPQRLEFEPLGGGRNLDVSPGRVELRASVPVLGSSSLIRVPVEIWVSGKKEAHVLVTGHLRVWRPTLVLRQNVKRGGILAKSHIESRVMDVIPLGSHRPQNIKEVLGLVAKVPLSKGAPILLSKIEKPMIVHQGDTLWILGRVGQIKVQARAKALENGALGDGIRVQNIKSGKKLKARVVGPGRVRIGQ